jgi:hypothetical protein
MTIADASELLVVEPVPARPRWWTQGLLIGLVWWSYDAINNLAPLRGASALSHGMAILRLETALHLDAERGLNRWLSAHVLIGRWLGNYYNLAHFTVTIGVLVWVWWRHAPRYRALRNGLLGINVIGFLVFWVFPVAPPRMLAGFTDVVAVTHSFGAWSSGALASQANEYAAMPSLHVAWALWCALAVWTVCQDRQARAFGVAYATLTSIVVMATANHYLLDVVAGALTAAAACSAILLERVRARRRTPPEPVASGPAATA